ncbi:MAG: hypothetical protein ACOCUS_01265 [Polyangiales bacterium]
MSTSRPIAPTAPMLATPQAGAPGDGWGQPPGDGGFGPPPGGGHGQPPGGGHGQPPGGGGYGQPPGGGYGQPPGGGYGHPPGGYGQPPGPTGPRTDALGIVATVCGAITLLGALANVGMTVFGTACCNVCGSAGGTIVGALLAIPGLVGVVLGVMSHKRIKEQPEELKGKELAMTGLVMSALGLLVTVVIVILSWVGAGCVLAGSAAGG